MFWITIFFINKATKPDVIGMTRLMYTDPTSFVKMDTFYWSHLYIYTYFAT